MVDQQKRIGGAMPSGTELPRVIKGLAELPMARLDAVAS
jgi:hypothetical protein